MERICCVCHRVKGQNGWKRKVVEQMREVSHGYCPDCYLLALRQIESDRFLSGPAGLSRRSTR